MLLVPCDLRLLLRERPLNRILHGLVFSRVLFPRIQEFNHGKFKAFLSC
jgi:hypothetical protein